MIKCLDILLDKLFLSENVFLGSQILRNGLEIEENLEFPQSFLHNFARNKKLPHKSSFL